MPTYQYECDACGHAFTQMQSITEPKLKECPACHGQTLQRLIGTGSGVIFKGSGFYETDYKNRSCADSKACPVKKDQAGGGCGCPSGGCSH